MFTLRPVSTRIGFDGPPLFKTLQASRAAAAIAVVLFHISATIALPKYFGDPRLFALFSSGDAGVEFFFVLSGFIVVWAHRDDFGRPRRLGRFFVKRAVRIYPTYWIIFLIVFITATALPPLRSTVPQDSPTILRALALMPTDQTLTGGTGAPVLIVSWSLQYEVLFYAVLALFIFSRLVGAVACAVLVWIFARCLGDSCAFPESFISNWVLLFVLGALVARIVQTQTAVFSRPKTISALALFALGLTAVMEIVQGKYLLYLDRRLVFGFFSAVLVLGLVKAEQAGCWQYVPRFLLLLGDASYTLYLIHFPVISLLAKAAMFAGFHSPPAEITFFVLATGICISLAVAFHTWIEKPLTVSLIRWWERPAAPLPR